MNSKRSAAIIGCLWGDEAKAKIADGELERGHYDANVRFQGGSNAGHTIYFKGKKYVLHSVPTGIFYEQIHLIIAGGCVFHPSVLMNEIRELESNGISFTGRFHIFSNCTIITKYELAIDGATEHFLANNSAKIGTTLKGIGPAYAHRAARIAISFEDLLGDDAILMEKLERLAMDVNPRLLACGVNPIEPLDVFNDLRQDSDSLRQYMVYNTYIGEFLESGKSALFEGAQGAGLDIINGTYPFTTSFPLSPGAIQISCNIPMNYINRIIGVAKIYPTRVGEGPFPTQIFGDEEELLRTLGKEFGATTGRARKCGWPDWAMLKYVIRSFGITELAVTCIDTLSKFSETYGNIKICEAYSVNGEILEYPKSITSAYLKRVEPVYKEFDLSCNCSGVNNAGNLTFKAADFINLMQNRLRTPIKMLSTGPNRGDVILL